MTARRIFLCLLLVVGSTFARESSKERTSQSDVFLVTIDTPRADHVHCYGYDRVQTPALNALARSGRLRRRHCLSSVTNIRKRTGQTGRQFERFYITTGTTHA